MKKVLAGIIIVIVLIAAVSGAGFIAYRQYEQKIASYETVLENYSMMVSESLDIDEDSGEAENTVSIDLGVVSEGIQSIGELATKEYLYTDAGTYSDSKLYNGRVIPLTTKSFILKWDGLIKAGVDATKITVSADDATQTITICIPKAVVISHEIDEKSVETLDQTNNVFNPVLIDDYNDFIANSKAAMTERAISNGLLDDAYKEAETLIYNFVAALPELSDNYEVIITALDEAV